LKLGIVSFITATDDVLVASYTVNQTLGFSYIDIRLFDISS